MEQAGRIFMIDGNNGLNSRYQHLLEEHGYEVFATDNAYKLIRYAPELQPRLYVVDNEAENVDAWQVLNYLVANRYLDEAPAVMLNAEASPDVVKGAAHYVARQDTDRLLEIVDAYFKGGAGYRVLLLEDNVPYSDKDFSGMDEFRVSYFKVYDAHGAKMFLQRNAPQALIVHSAEEDYDKIKSEIGFKNTFYVENRNNLQKLFSFLK